MQWTTGNVGRRSVIAVAANPGLELVGCYAWGADKVGRDVGELCGIEPLGILATDDVDALLALRARLRRLQPEVARRRRDGAHPRGRASTSCRPPRSSPATRSARVATRIIDGVRARRRRRSSAAASTPGSPTCSTIVVGRDLRPGRLGLGARVGRLHRLRLPRDRAPGRLRPTRSTTPPSPTWRARAPRCSRTRCWLVADALGRRARRRAVRSRVRGRPPRTSSSTSWTIPAGCVAGVSASWQGWVDDRKVIDLKVRWRKGPTLEPDWELGEGYLRRDPGAAVRAHQARDLPAARLRGQDLRRLHGARHDHDRACPRSTRSPRSCAAAPGIVTYLDLPLITRAGLRAVRR